MKHRIHRFFIATSLLLCVATAVLWIWSYRSGGSWYLCRNTDSPDAGELNDNLHVELSFGGGSGFAYFYYDDSFWPIRRVDEWEHAFNSRAPEWPEPWQLFSGRDWIPKWGFGAYLDWRPMDNRQIAVLMPLWVFVLLFAILPGRFLWRKIRRRMDGTCETCCYDLRATPERCPECGLRQAQSSGTARMAE